LYGPLPNQLKDSESFAARLKNLIAARKKYRLAEGTLLAAPEAKSSGVCLLVLKLPDHPLAVTVLNFGRQEASEDLALGEQAGKGSTGQWIDILSGQPASAPGGRVTVPALTGTTFVWSNRP
jgi:maltose alpha-D-glucosyltransferase/alpha-amylase